MRLELRTDDQMMRKP